jgi:two-component system chemotaxis response regulator CheB
VSTHDIVVIGASAGGVSALRSLVASLPADFPAVVFVVLHVGAHASVLPAILAAAGPNVAAHARHGDPIRPGRILVAPPDHHLLLEDDQVTLTRGPKEHHTRPAIDPLFRSAAIAHGPRAIGVVLTGTLDDGTAGLQAIKECGGLAVVQDPADAECPEMPRIALAHVQVDHCVPLAAMGPLLARLVGQPAAAPQAVPDALAREHGITLQESHTMDELDAIGTPSGLVCPDCQGALWELRGTRPPRYRCHTGHAFSLSSLKATLDTATEEALWSAIRALQEKAQVLRRSAAAARAEGAAADHVSAAEAMAAHVQQQANALRAMVEREQDA